jgi:hypothetical protein
MWMASFSDKKIVPLKKLGGKSATFMHFAQTLQTGDIKAAAGILSQLLGVNPNQGLASTKHYAEKLLNEPNLIHQTMELREHVAKNHTIDGLYLIEVCFGIQVPEALQVFENLKRQLG